MAGAQILNLGSNEEKIPSNDAQPVADDVHRLRTRVSRQEDQQEAHERRTKVLSVILGGLIVSLVALLWSVYPTVRDSKKGLADLFTLQNITGTLTERLSSAEGTINNMKKDVPALSGRIDKVQTNVKADLQTARNQMNRSLRAIQSRLSGLESNQKESSEQMNRLQEQVKTLQQEIAVMHAQTQTSPAKSQEELPIEPAPQN